VKAFTLPNISAPIEISELLFAAWVQFYAAKRFELSQYGAGNPADSRTTYSYGRPTEKNFIFERSENQEWSLLSSKGIAEKDIEEIVNDAMGRFSAGDFGGDVVYQTELEVKGFTIDSVSNINFMRLLGDQVHIDGSRRLGSRVLLDFVPDPPEDPSVPQLFAPRTSVKVTLFVPGPIASGLTNTIANGMVEVVAAICALALGRVATLPLAIFPASPEDAEKAQRRRFDQAILGLARDGISLDVFDEFSTLGGGDGVMRIRGALLSYHLALQQPNPDVAMMLFVSAIEALIIPHAEWRKEKATKRFIVEVDRLCEHVVENLVNHANVEQAFAYKKKGGPKARHRQLLDRIYELRSVPTHSGIGLSGVGMISIFASQGNMRVALLSDLVRGALLSFLQAPRSSLIGHPMFEQTPTNPAPADDK